MNRNLTTISISLLAGIAIGVGGTVLIQHASSGGSGGAQVALHRSTTSAPGATSSGTTSSATATSTPAPATLAPTATTAPTAAPTRSTTASPTNAVTSHPTSVPTAAPTAVPTSPPTQAPVPQAISVSGHDATSQIVQVTATHNYQFSFSVKQNPNYNYCGPGCSPGCAYVMDTFTVDLISPDGKTYEQTADITWGTAGCGFPPITGTQLVALVQSGWTLKTDCQHCDWTVDITPAS